ncbi:Hypothetical protein A7982_06086 [Minicystis rosea]|nr:Hypothetical protein A7982_06086 [Minicystis rosea]
MVIATLLAAPACGSGAGADAGGTGGTDTSMTTGTGMPETCTDGVQDGNESDVDCGGSCAPCAAFAHCSVIQDCAEGTRCHQDEGCQFPEACNSICAPQHQGSCDTTTCEPGQFCAPGHEEGTSLCFKAAAAGQPCNDDFVNSCVDGYFCDTFEGCKPKVPAGGTCSESSACPDGYYCSLTHKCEKRLAAGKPCMFFDACNPDLYCDFTQPSQPVCTPRGAEGESCHDALGSCLSVLQCVFPAGLACTTSQDCSGSGATCCATTNGAVCKAPTPDCAPPSGTCQ